MIEPYSDRFLRFIKNLANVLRSWLDLFLTFFLDVKERNEMKGIVINISPFVSE